MHRYLSHFNQEKPSYLIITVALLKAEVFWVCSAISCLYHSTKSIPTNQITFHNIDNNIPQDIIISVTDESDIKEDTIQLSEKEHYTAHRRLSLPSLAVNDNGIRHRPSAEDEMNGTTCPPVWWQKAKIKLSSASNSKNHRSIDSDKENLLYTPSFYTTEGNAVIDNNQLSLSYLQPIDSVHNSAPSIISQSSNSSEKKHQHRAKQMMTKIKTRIVKISHHRRGASLDLDKFKV
ncbi:hypothetical protein INT46_008897 [Mucor plumbeus]|uniref:Uncharacterized protein n=1 Tax=Mucor plumbeus TaxID=97098 RepID=A0A8H7QHY4_9FUNG|nr:hypothetical protein INT46_008897 [Mucor plumbeus]